MIPITIKQSSHVKRLTERLTAVHEKNLGLYREQLSLLLEKNGRLESSIQNLVQRVASLENSGIVTFFYKVLDNISILYTVKKAKENSEALDECWDIDVGLSSLSVGVAVPSFGLDDIHLVSMPTTPTPENSGE